MKAVIYALYSSDSQREESIEGQLRDGVFGVWYINEGTRSREHKTLRWSVLPGRGANGAELRCTKCKQTAA